MYVARMTEMQCQGPCTGCALGAGYIKWLMHAASLMIARGLSVQGAGCSLGVHVASVTHLYAFYDLG